ncbi:MAG: hypothetical protein IPK67_18345 [Planctomycetes bacterium]|nr:hypothetical protein [Planctomycetota bacterium]
MLVAEYRYNGLGYRTGVHEDTDTDGDVDGSDLWYYSAYDERRRMVATYRSSDTDPKDASSTSRRATAAQGQLVHRLGGVPGEGREHGLDERERRDA